MGCCTSQRTQLPAKRNSVPLQNVELPSRNSQQNCVEDCLQVIPPTQMSRHSMASSMFHSKMQNDPKWLFKPVNVEGCFKHTDGDRQDNKISTQNRIVESQLNPEQTTTQNTSQLTNFKKIKI